jgi:acetolactate synthase I/II/III large subunit
MLVETAEVADAHRVGRLEIWPGRQQMEELRTLLCAAERPVVILGGTGWDESASIATVGFAERFDLPVAASFRRASLFPNDHPCYVGELGIGPNPKLRRRIENSDLVVLMGARMSETASQGYQLFDIPTPRQKLAHVYADAMEIGRVYHPALGIVATPNAFAAAAGELQPPAAVAWASERKAARADYLSWSEAPPPEPGPVRMSEIMLWLRDRLAPDTIITNGAGNFALWVGRFLRFRRFGCHIGPVSGSMGYGLPAAVAAKRVHPDRPVVCFCGDGDFLMSGQEFATAVQYGLAIVVIVIDNGMYGTIRMHQERRYPGRVCGTELRNPDFAAYARAFGGHGETVETTDEFAAAFERSCASNKPSILHLKIDPEAKT